MESWNQEKYHRIHGGNSFGLKLVRTYLNYFVLGTSTTAVFLWNDRKMKKNGGGTSSFYTVV